MPVAVYPCDHAESVSNVVTAADVDPYFPAAQRACVLEKPTSTFQKTMSPSVHCKTFGVAVAAPTAGNADTYGFSTVRSRLRMWTPSMRTESRSPNLEFMMKWGWPSSRLGPIAADA